MMRSVLIVGGTVAFGLGLIVLWAVMSRPPASERAPMTYVDAQGQLGDYVELGRVGLAAAENFVGHRILIVTGSVRNASLRPLRSVEMHLAFHDLAGGTVHEFDGDALRSTLPAGESRPFEFRFENLPEEWNRAVPLVEVRRIGY